MVPYVALCVRSALRTRILTFKFDTGERRTALVVTFALVSASGDGGTMETRKTFTCRHVVDHFALSVLATGAGVAQFS